MSHVTLYEKVRNFADTKKAVEFISKKNFGRDVVLSEGQTILVDGFCKEIEEIQRDVDDFGMMKFQLHNLWIKLRENFGFVLIRIKVEEVYEGNDEVP